MIKIVVLTALKTLLTAVLTERFLVNMTLMILEWLASRTENDLDDRALGHLRDALDRKQGANVNLYDELRR